MTPTQVSTAIDQLSDIFAAIPQEEVWQATRDMPSEHLGELYRRMDNILIAATKFKMSILGSHLTPPLLGAIPDQAELMSLLYAIDPTKLSRDALGAIGVEVCNKLGPTMIPNKLTCRRTSMIILVRPAWRRRIGMGRNGNLAATSTLNITTTMVTPSIASSIRLATRSTPTATEENVDGSGFPWVVQ